MTKEITLSDGKIAVIKDGKGRDLLNAQISLTLVAFDKMSKVLRDAVHSSNAEFDKMQNKIQSLSSNLESIGRHIVKKDIFII